MHPRDYISSRGIITIGEKFADKMVFDLDLAEEMITNHGTGNFTIDRRDYSDKRDQGNNSVGSQEISGANNNAVGEQLN